MYFLTVLQINNAVDMDVAIDGDRVKNIELEHLERQRKTHQMDKEHQNLK